MIKMEDLKMSKRNITIAAAAVVFAVALALAPVLADGPGTCPGARQLRRPPGPGAARGATGRGANGRWPPTGAGARGPREASGVSK